MAHVRTTAPAGEGGLGIVIRIPAEFNSPVNPGRRIFDAAVVACRQKWRKGCGWPARKNIMMTNRELAEHIGRVGESAVVQAVRSLEKRIQNDSRLARESLQNRLDPGTPDHKADQILRGVIDQLASLTRGDDLPTLSPSDRQSPPPTMWVSSLAA